MVEYEGYKVKIFVNGFYSILGQNQMFHKWNTFLDFVTMQYHKI